MSYEEEDTCVRMELLYEEEDICHMRRRIHVCVWSYYMRRRIYVIWGGGYMCAYGVTVQKTFENVCGPGSLTIVFSYPY
jgi:hypothetical protein